MEKRKRRNRKNCKYYRQRGLKTAYCDFLGKGLLCYKVCNMWECKHWNVTGSDGLSECLDCGVRDY